MTKAKLIWIATSEIDPTRRELSFEDPCDDIVPIMHYPSGDEELVEWKKYVLIEIED